jgi:hypothetical protein
MKYLMGHEIYGIIATALQLGHMKYLDVTENLMY